MSYKYKERYDELNKLSEENITKYIDKCEAEIKTLNEKLNKSSAEGERHIYLVRDRNLACKIYCEKYKAKETKLMESLIAERANKVMKGNTK